ncbi:MAG TPA: hypothetical protein VMK53_07780 [Gemmatimonadales bacterium]|nr:hypothetical protein [Gemmatimonadales bacterium]
MLRITMRFGGCVLSAISLVACGGDRGSEDLTLSASTLMVRDSGFATIGGVVHDGVSDVYFVSSINGEALAEDGNGFISVVSGEGEVFSLKQVDAAATGVALHAPKGLVVVDSILYVTDIHTIWRFNRDSGAPLGSTRIAGATSLHAIVAHPNSAVYFTDAGFRPGAEGSEPSGTDAVYRLWPDGRLDTLAMGPELGRPTGIAVTGDSVWVVGSATGELYRLEDGQRVDVQKVAERLEGLAVTETAVFVTDPINGTLFRGLPGGTFQPTATGLPGPRAVAFDRWRFRVLVVTDMGQEIRAFPLAF